MLMHCPHVKYSDVYQVFDKMPKWHFLIVLDSDMYQTLGIIMIMYVYYVLIIGCVFYTLCPLSAYSCIGRASHMHTRCTHSIT